jgi:predicted Zn-dependent protease with MMP-like domain
MRSIVSIHRCQCYTVLATKDVSQRRHRNKCSSPLFAFTEMRARVHLEDDMSRATLRHQRRSRRSQSISRLPQPCPLTGVYKKTQEPGITLEAFVRLVARALDSLPDEIVEKLSNVAVAVEDQPSPEVLAETGCRSPHDLFGLYRGIPRPWRSTFAPLSDFPDKIEIYYQPIVRAGLRPREIQELVRRVVIHEVGHHFGMSDQQLRALGY